MPASPFEINVRTLVGKPGTMRELELRLPVRERIGEGMVAVPAGSELELSLRLESLHDGILATARVDAELSGECSRCLEAIDDELRVEFAELFAYALDDALEYRVHDDQIDLEPPVRDAVVLALPFQPVCEPDCLGLDPETGEKLTEPRPAQEDRIDPRWAALSQFGADPSDPDAPSAQGR